MSGMFKNPKSLCEWYDPVWPRQIDYGTFEKNV